MAIFWVIFVSLLFPYLWFYYFYRKDPHPEPKLWIFLAFLLGVLSAFFAYFLQEGLVYLGITKDNYFTLHYLLSAFTEEISKFVFVWLFIFRRNKNKVFDEPVDAIVYLAASAFGFAILENLAVQFSGLNSYANHSVWFLGFVRFIGANLLHILASVMLAFGYAEALSIRRLYPFTISVVLSTFLHFWYNVLTLSQNYVVHVLPILWAMFPIILIEIGHLKLHHETFSGGRERRGQGSN